MIDPKLPTCAICKRPVRGMTARDGDDPLVLAPKTFRFEIYCHGAVEVVEFTRDEAADFTGPITIPGEAFAGDGTVTQLTR